MNSEFCNQQNPNTIQEQGENLILKEHKKKETNHLGFLTTMMSGV
jgi:hypothetical protein